MVAMQVQTGPANLMTRAKLVEMIRQRTPAVEFRPDAIDSFAFARDIVAFANGYGGRVLFGVADDGAITGTTRPNLEEWVMKASRDNVRPGLIPFYELIKDVAPGRNVTVVTIPASSAVHATWHDNRRVYYVRMGSETREASQGELRRLFALRGGGSAEMRPVSGTRLADLDMRRLRDYFVRVRRQEVPDDEDNEGWSRLLVNTEIMAEEGACTAAGLLLFGLKPMRFLPHAAIDCAAFPGTEKDYAMLERTTLRVPLVALFYKNETLRVVEPGLVEEAFYFVRRNTGATASFLGPVRIDRLAYPEGVIREAVVNAIVHRDYTLSGTTIELSVYSDRVEIISPGRLPNGITPARMRAGCRSTRNELIKDVLRDYEYMESIGLGVPRKLVKGMLAHNGTEPDLIEQDERFIVRLWKEKKA